VAKIIIDFITSLQCEIRNFSEKTTKFVELADFKHVKGFWKKTITWSNHYGKEGAVCVSVTN
jgi:hypothetical protein